jgi:VIT1/CCC1 family predicted Fe2+/Mn2+ transporter
MPITQIRHMCLGSSLQFLVKLAFLFGSFLIVFPMLLRAIDAVDNSFAFTFIAIGFLVVVIGELNRARVEDLSPVS